MSIPSNNLNFPQGNMFGGPSANWNNSPGMWVQDEKGNDVLSKNGMAQDTLWTQALYEGDPSSIVGNPPITGGTAEERAARQANEWAKQAAAAQMAHQTASAEKAMQFEADQAAKQMQYQTASAEKAMQFEKAEARLNRAFQAEQQQIAMNYNTSEAEKQRQYATLEAEKANAWSAAQAQITRDYQTASAEKAMQFESSETQKARDYQKEMSNTAYQRAVQDLKAAGLNPILAALGSGATSPMSSSASAFATQGATGSAYMPSSSAATVGMQSGSTARGQSQSGSSGRGHSTSGSKADTYKSKQGEINAENYRTTIQAITSVIGNITNIASYGMLGSSIGKVKVPSAYYPNNGKY